MLSQYDARYARNLGQLPPQKWQPRRRKTRLKLLLLLAIGALIVSTVLAAADLYREGITLSIQVDGQQNVPVDLNQSVAVSPYLLGSNVFPRAGTSAKDAGGRGFMSYDEQVVLGLRSAGVKLLRFPGGNWGEQHTPSRQQLNDFSALLNQLGAQGIMQVQLSDPQDATAVPLQTRASRAALLVDYMNNSKSIQRLGEQAPFHPVTYWTIGNEPDLLINPDTRQRYTVDEYTQAFIAYSLAMHQRDPGIKIFGPEISSYAGQPGPRDALGKPWMGEFLRQVSAYERTHALSFHLLDGVSFHAYPFGDTQPRTAALLNNPASWNTILPTLRQFIRQQFGEDLPIAITEINTNAGKLVPPPALAATWWADTLGELMSNQVAYVAFFASEGVNVPYPLFTQKLQETAMLRAMQLFAHLQQYTIPLQAARSGPLHIVATQAQGHATVSLLFVNRSAASQRVSVQSSGLLPFSGWQRAQLSIPAYGMAVLQLSRGGGDEAFSFSNQENAPELAPDIQRLTCASNTAAALAC